MVTNVKLVILGFVMIIIPVAMYYTGVRLLWPYVLWGIPTIIISIYIRLYRREYIKVLSIGTISALLIGLIIGLISGDMGLFTRHRY